MNDEQLVEEHARKFAAQFSGFLKACDIIGRGGAIGQLADEAQKRYDDLVAKADDLTVKHHAAEQALVQAQAALVDANTQAALLKKFAADEADATRAQAEQLMQAARASIADERTAAAQAANAAAGQLIADTHASLADVKAHVAAQQEYLAALDGAVASRQLALDRLKQERSALLQRLQESAE